MPVQCPICSWQGNSFNPAGLIPRPNALCPECGALERHRLLYLYLKDRTDFFARPQRILHIAPEAIFQKLFSKMPHLDYVSADIDSDIAMKRFDITSVPYSDDTFDSVICYHVLEHIVEDVRAVRELFRVLKPGGWGILQSPWEKDREHTYEDAKITSPEARLKAFGQKDHVRIYGKDYMRRLQNAGFAVLMDDYASGIPADTAASYGIRRTETIFLCRKPNPASFSVDTSLARIE